MDVTIPKVATALRGLVRAKTIDSIHVSQGCSIWSPALCLPWPRRRPANTRLARHEQADAPELRQTLVGAVVRRAFHRRSEPPHVIDGTGNARQRACVRPHDGFLARLALARHFRQPSGRAEVGGIVGHELGEYTRAATLSIRHRIGTRHPGPQLYQKYTTWRRSSPRRPNTSSKGNIYNYRTRGFKKEKSIPASRTINKRYNPQSILYLLLYKSGD